MRALFLGAGASYEVGMPLVWEFTETLRSNILKRIDTNLFNFKGSRNLKLQFISILSDQKLHYEQMVAKLEKLYLDLRTSPDERDIVHGLITQLTECIQLLLLEDQQLIKGLLQDRIKSYYGLTSFIMQNSPTYVYSLNHDVVFEEVCSYLGIPLKDGFFDDSRKYGHIAPFYSVSVEQLKNGNLNLFTEKDTGINLIKLHGSLDIFGVEDMKFFLKVKGSGACVGSHIEAATEVEKHSQAISIRDQHRTTNELCVEDSDGEIQFLRRSLLSGGNKFKGEISQIAPVALLNKFRDSLPLIRELTVIGYSFGDAHINKILYDWMVQSHGKSTIYDPYMKNVPTIFDGYESQVKIMNAGFTDFCLHWDSSQESYSSRTMRDALELVRQNLKKRREKKT